MFESEAVAKLNPFLSPSPFMGEGWGEGSHRGLNG